MPETAPPTIALLSSGPLDIGGIMTHMLSLVQHSHKRFRWVAIGPILPAFRDAAQQAGVAVFPWETTGQYDHRAITELITLFITENISLVHSHLTRGSLHAGIAARKVGIPMVVTVHGPAYDYPGVKEHPLKRWVYQRLESYINHHLASKVIYVSQTVYQQAVKMKVAPLDTSLVIGNGVEVSLFTQDVSSARSALGVDEKDLLVSYIGRLSPEKGADLLIEAVTPLVVEYPNLQCWLVGDGPQREALVQAIDRARLREKVRLLGQRADIPTILAATDLVVLPSRSEVMSVALLEAMAAGKACLVTDVGENSQLVRDGIEGCVIPPNDSDALARAIRLLLDHPEQREEMGVAARLRSRDYDIRVGTQRVYDVYDELLSRFGQHRATV